MQISTGAGVYSQITAMRSVHPTNHRMVHPCDIVTVPEKFDLVLPVS